MKKNHIVKILAIGIIVLFIGVNFPIISANNYFLVDNLTNVKEPNLKGIYDNFLIEARGLYLFDILMLLITKEPVPFIETLIVNNNANSLTVEPHFKVVATQGNRVLEYFQGPTRKMTPGVAFVYFLFDQFRWEKWDYTFGLFDYILELHVQETDSDIKVVFHGFVFGIGAIIFNPWGKIIE